jgi:hypothetical protein
VLSKEAWVIKDRNRIQRRRGRAWLSGLASKARDQDAVATAPPRKSSAGTVGPLTQDEMAAALEVARVVRPWRLP